MALSVEESFERCCRLCAEEQDVTIMIFSPEAEAMLLQNKLQKYLLIEVDEDDKLPKNICIDCCTGLQKVCEFIDIAHKAQEMLLNRCNMIEEHRTQNTVFNEANQIKTEPQLYDDIAEITELEVNVDPMLVLQNSETSISFNNDRDENVHQTDQADDALYRNWHGVDSENVTIKLIKRGVPSKSPEHWKDTVMKPFPCKTCRRSFITELALKNHSWIHCNEDKIITKLFKCYSCEASFNYKFDLIEHLKEHRITKSCVLCGRGFRAQRALAAHMAIHMSGHSSYTCKVCGRSYNTQSNLKAHSVSHSNERPYSCHVCKKSFKRNQDLKFHINQHTGAKPYKCPFCDKSFASSGNCYSHRSRMHPGRRIENRMYRRVTANRENQPQTDTQKSSTPAKPNLVCIKGVYKYKCQLCEHTFMRRDNFTYHMYQHTGEKPFQCSFCNEKFVTRKGLLIHHDKEHPTMNRPLALISKNALLK